MSLIFWSRKEWVIVYLPNIAEISDSKSMAPIWIISSWKLLNLEVISGSSDFISRYSINFSPTSVTLSDTLLIWRSSIYKLLFLCVTEYSLQYLHFLKEILFFFDLLLCSLRGSHQRAKPARNRFIVVLNVLFHLLGNLQYRLFKLQLLLLPISILAGIHKLQKALASRYLCLIVIN